jgi:hypothetical protein
MFEIVAQSITHAGGVPMADGVRLFPVQQARVPAQASKAGLVSRLVTVAKAAWSGARSGARRGWVDATCDVAAH